MSSPRGLHRWALPGYCLILTVAVIGPLLGTGYLLLRDAVSTPRSYLTDAALGLGGTAPRAVPQDFAVAVLSRAVDGGLVVKALLGLALFLAGWGAARLSMSLLPEAGLPGGYVAATVAIWNPYVGERILQGHWSLLLGYGCLPWVAAAVLRMRTIADRRAWAGVVFWICVAGLTPTGLILATVVALVSLGGGIGRWRGAAGITATAALAGSPWLLASALGGALGFSQSDGLMPFAARAEPGLGTLGSLAGLGGIWNADAVMPSRATAFAVVGTAVLLVIVACGLPVVLRRPAARPLLVLAAAAVLVPAALATGAGLAVLRAIVEAVPGLAVLRDGQKWVALAMPGYAVAAAGSVVSVPAVRRWFRPAAAAAAGCAALIAVLPDLAWGVWGRMAPVHYPPGWPAVAATVNAERNQGTVLALPADGMRLFAWAGSAPVLDPLPRWLRAEVLSTGDVSVAGRTVAGEGTRARLIQDQALGGADPSALVENGVGWVVLEAGTPGALGAAARTLKALPVAYRDGDLTLYRVGGVSAGVSQSRRLGVIAAHLVWTGMLLGSAVVLAVQSLRRSSCRPYRRS